MSSEIKIKELVLSEYEKGNIVISGFDGLEIAPLKEVLNQPIDGLLYDLNRGEMVILNFIDDKKWVNDYALTKVVRELHKQNEEKDNLLKSQEEQYNKLYTAYQEIDEEARNSESQNKDLREECLLKKNTIEDLKFKVLSADTENNRLSRLVELADEMSKEYEKINSNANSLTEYKKLRQ